VWPVEAPCWSKVLCWMGEGVRSHFKPAAVSILKGMSDARAFLTSLLDP